MTFLAKWVVDPYLRRRAKVHETPVERFRVDVARSQADYDQAFKLVHAAYVIQGYESVHASSCRMFPQHFLPEAYVLVARDGDTIVGTLTVTLDSPAGLPLDKDFPEALQSMRAEGKRLAEYGALAVVQRCWHTGVANLLHLAATTLAARALRPSHVVIGVNPRVVRYHRALYSFESFAGARDHASLHAPVAGMVLDLVAAEKVWQRTFRKPMATGYSFFEHAWERHLPCIDVPRSPSEARRERMGREIWQSLAERRPDVVGQLRATNGDYLKRARSRATLRVLERMPTTSHAI